VSLSARLFELAESQGRSSLPAQAEETGAFAREAAQLELRARVVDAIAGLLPPHAPLRIGCRRYGEHVVVWIDTTAEAREGSGPTLEDALLSAAVAGPAARRAPKNARHSGL
jgi:hypothetical protein